MGKERPVLHEDVAALLPEVRDYLSSLKPTELPMSLDNWAAMVGLDYKHFRVAMMHLDRKLYRAYVDHRTSFWKMIEEDLRSLAGSPDYTAKYTRPIVEKYGITFKDIQRIRTRLGLMCVPKYSRVAEAAMKVIKEGMTLMDLAEASGLTLQQIQGMQSRGHLDEWVDFSFEKRLVPSGRRQRVIVVSKLKKTEKPRDRSKSRR